jgi:hypothetical protein
MRTCGSADADPVHIDAATINMPATCANLRLMMDLA